MGFEYPPDRQAFWNDYVVRAGWGIHSQDAYDEFLAQRSYLGGLFDIWADPNQDDWAQAIANKQFWRELRSFGLDRDSFDWHAFRDKYKIFFV